MACHATSRGSLILTETITPIVEPPVTRLGSGEEHRPFSSVERPGTADKLTAPQEESQPTVSRARDADPFALSNGAERLTI
jgi:hypothetical protein